jgi:hypothetical protein
MAHGRRGGSSPPVAHAMNAEGLSVQVHRFHDTVALGVNGATVYLTRRQTLDLQRALKAAAVDVAKHPGGVGLFGTFQIVEE